MFVTFCSLAIVDDSTENGVRVLDELRSMVCVMMEGASNL